MSREPIMESGRITGYRVTTGPVYITVRDNRGYESTIMIHPRETIIEPVARQSGIFDEAA
jgi:lipopolysaccharide biosynthesis protein